MIEYTVVVCGNGDKYWYLNGQLHREDGPAIEWANGHKSWWLNGELHREDGPAIEYANGNKYWFKNHKLHREDGPAEEWADGDKYWYLKGKEVTEEEHKKLTSKDTCAGKVVEIDGIKYELKEV